MNTRIPICFCGQFPPPVHGQSVMNQALRDGVYNRLVIHAVPMAFSHDIPDVGRFRPGKLPRLFQVAARLAWVRIRHRAALLYYPPAPPQRVPLWRDFILLILTRWMFRKTVFHFHGPDARGLTPFYRERLTRLEKVLFQLAYRRPDLALYLSAHAPRDAELMRPRAIRIVPNGMPDNAGQFTDRADRAARRIPHILFLGSIGPEKGVDTLVEALTLLHQRGHRFEAVLAGPDRHPAFTRTLHDRIRAGGLESCVRVPGGLYGPDKARAYLDADLFAFPSRTDTFGLVVLEAMLYSLPAVVADRHGLKDLVEDGVTGYRCPPDEPAAFADRIARLLEQPARRLAMGKAARTRYENGFTLETWRRAMEDALVACAEGQTSPQPTDPA